MICLGMQGLPDSRKWWAAPHVPPEQSALKVGKWGMLERKKERWGGCRASVATKSQV